MDGPNGQAVLNLVGVGKEPRLAKVSQWGDLVDSVPAQDIKLKVVIYKVVMANQIETQMGTVSQHKTFLRHLLTTLY